MSDKKILLRILVMALISGMTVVGCAQFDRIEKKVDEGQTANKTGFNNVKTETNNLNKKTDDLNAKTDNLNLKTDDLHEKVDDLTLKMDYIIENWPPRGANGGGGGGGGDPQARYVPVSMEILDRIKAVNIDLDDLDYYISANITVYFNDTNNKLEVQDGKLVETKTHQSMTIPISTADVGKKVSGGWEFFAISFTEENIILMFEKNRTKNRFDLVSASKGSKNYALPFGRDRPYLVIDYRYTPNDESIQVQGITFSFGGDDGGKYRLSPPVDTATITERIEGWGTLNPAVIIQFIQEQNRSYTRNFLEDFIGTYFGEARALGINPDLAIAQMCYVTNFLRNEKAMSTRNYAGFTTMPAGGRFRNREEGIQAHIQHLKGYADDRYRPSHIVDPRWNNLDNVRGTVNSLDGLARIWAPNNRYYAADIANIIDDMRYYAQGRA
jgi:hypothetical protein